MTFLLIIQLAQHLGHPRAIGSNAVLLGWFSSGYFWTKCTCIKLYSINSGIRNSMTNWIKNPDRYFQADPPGYVASNTVSIDTWNQRVNLTGGERYWKLRGANEDFSMATIEFLWRALKFKRFSGYGPPFPPPIWNEPCLLGVIM